MASPTRAGASSIGDIPGAWNVDQLSVGISRRAGRRGDAVLDVFADTPRPAANEARRRAHARPRRRSSCTRAGLDADGIARATLAPVCVGAQAPEATRAR